MGMRERWAYVNMLAQRINEENQAYETLSKSLE